MIKKHSIDADEYYNPDFYKQASYQIIEKNYYFIGQIISQFNSIENDINDYLVDYINNEIEDIGWIVITDLDFSAKLKLWKRIVTYFLTHEKDLKVKEDMTNEIAALNKDITKLMEIRNKIAHADWDNMNENLFVKVQTKLENDSIKHIHLTINEEEFDIISAEFDAVDKRLTNFGDTLEKILGD